MGPISTPLVLPALQLEVVYYLADSKSIGQAICSRAEDLNVSMKTVRSFICCGFLTAGPSTAPLALKCRVQPYSIAESACIVTSTLQVDLVVMAKQQKNKLERYFLGSVSEFVTKNCQRNLLLLN